MCLFGGCWFLFLNNTSGVCNTTLGGRFGHDTALVHRFTYCLAKGWNANDEPSTMPVDFESPNHIPRTTTTRKERQQLANIVVLVPIGVMLSSDTFRQCRFYVCRCWCFVSSNKSSVVYCLVSTMRLLCGHALPSKQYKISR